ncbi:MAG TPA: hypothetical protein VEX39_11760 [Thermoleophilaceae bacterium]|nr:hypothetical protein [Thermoleophilaceae bacterium]
MAASIIQDLRQRRLLPVAILLLAAAVALPLLALKSSSEPVAPPVQGAAAGNTAPAGGLPTPQQALSDKPLVSLAVLEGDSNLDQFESKDPFKPIEQVSADGASSGGSSDAVPSNTAASGGPGGGSGSSGGADTGSGGSGGGGDQQQTTTPKGNDTPTDNGGGTAPKTEKKLTYAVDLTIRGPKGLRSYRNLPKLSLLPAADNPLLVFLGVEDAGTKAVFLVDAKLKSIEGEGTCSPSPAQCATLALAPGEEHVLGNDQGQTWTIRIVEVRETSVAKAAAAARKASKRQARRATRTVGEQRVPRFIPPVITDLFTGGRS